MTRTLTPQRVRDTLEYVFFKEEELAEGGEAPDNAVIVEGVMLKAGFHRERLEERREDVREMLSQLLPEFRNGHTFLYGHALADGGQWTGVHQSVDELVTLGLALGLVEFSLPRDMWDALPGGLPYIQVKL